MKINRVALKRNAKVRIFTTKPSPLAIGILYIALSYILSMLASRLDGTYYMMQDFYDQYLEGNLVYLPEFPQVSPYAWVIVFAISIMALVLNAGFSAYCLKICNGEKADHKNLMDGFNVFFKLILLTVLSGLFVFLWSLLFIIPGIIAAYRYRMALYILLENPELGALECLRRSKQMMAGRKFELFVIDLSFLGWIFLTSFPLFSIWVTPYMTVTYAGYYIALRDIPHIDYRAE